MPLQQTCSLYYAFTADSSDSVSVARAPVRAPQARRLPLSPLQFLYNRLMIFKCLYHRLILFKMSLPPPYNFIMSLQPPYNLDNVFTAAL